MEIKLPENPNLYLILLGFFFIGFAFLFVVITGKTNFSDYIIIFLGVILFAWGFWGLRSDSELRKQLLKAQINKIKKETDKL